MAVASWPQGAWRWLAARRRVAVAAALVSIGAAASVWLLAAKHPSAPPALPMAWRGARSPFVLSPAERDGLRRLGVSLIVASLGEVAATGELARGTPAWGAGQFDPPIWLEVTLREPIAPTTCDRLVASLDRAWQGATACGWRPMGIVLDLRHVATAERRARAIECVRRWLPAMASLAVWLPEGVASADPAPADAADEYLLPCVAAPSALRPRGRIRLVLPIATRIAATAPDGQSLASPPLDLGRIPADPDWRLVRAAMRLDDAGVPVADEIVFVREPERSSREIPAGSEVVFRRPRAEGLTAALARWQRAGIALAGAVLDGMPGEPGALTEAEVAGIVAGRVEEKPAKLLCEPTEGGFRLALRNPGSAASAAAPDAVTVAVAVTVGSVVAVRPEAFAFVGCRHRGREVPVREASEFRFERPFLAGGETAPVATFRLLPGAQPTVRAAWQVATASGRPPWRGEWTTCWPASPHQPSRGDGDFR